MTREDFSAIDVAARTHPPEYSLHKYWARKPHNVVRRALEACGVGPGSIIVDPCCGSGVPLSEAARLRATCIGIDVNPVAVELTRTTLCPPPPEAYRAAVDGILDELERDFGSQFRLGGRAVRYAVHATVVDCQGCGTRLSADEARRHGRTYICPKCESRLYFNLENLVATRQLHAALDDGSRFSGPFAEETTPRRSLSPCDQAFTPNTRILAFEGMRSRDLFSDRSFAILSAFAQRIGGLPERLRAAAGLTLTGSVAQCSRLVAYRNGLTTGGPAWTVPGFWVPPIHLETNPLIHLRTRVRRFEKGLRRLNELGGRSSKHDVRVGDAKHLAMGEVLGRQQASLVFLDPPYGDSVPYLEFSALWNAFLGVAPDPGLDLAVSNRTRGDGTWERYREGLSCMVAGLRSSLRSDGRFLVTFNNRDLRAWRALLEALHGAMLGCQGAFYQHPAVVSTKAQLARVGSYVGDFYCVFAPTMSRPADVAVGAEAVRRALAAAVPKTDLERQRTALLELLRANVTADALDELPEWIA